MTFAKTLFELSLYIAPIGWLALLVSVFMPRVRSHVWPVTQFVFPAIFCVFYLLMLWDGRAYLHPDSFFSLSALGLLYAQPSPLAASWFHFFALDIFVGTWIVRDGTGRGMPGLLILPCLLLAFLLAPSGLLLYFALRFMIRPKAAA
jgi:hypothetical protein